MRAAALAACAAACLAVTTAASASQLIARNASHVRIAADAKGQALLRYTVGGKAYTVAAWGAVDARQPSASTPQVKLRLDYSGRSGAGLVDTCRKYDGPVLAWFVTACKAGDGSYWAVQQWQRALPNVGYRPWMATQTVWELHLSHWTAKLGPAQFEVYRDWVYGGRFHDLFGRVTYDGQAVHGFKSTSTGGTLDPYGRNLYLDTFDSAYGSGWRRENSFLAHNPSGMFCYAFTPYSAYPGYPHQRDTKLDGHGKRYRITMIGPGVSPDVMWQGEGLPDYNQANVELTGWERQMNAKLDALDAQYGERACRQH